MTRQEPAHKITLRSFTSVAGRNRAPVRLALVLPLLQMALASQGTAPRAAAAQPDHKGLLFRSKQAIQAGNEHHYRIQERGIIDKYRLLV